MGEKKEMKSYAFRVWTSWSNWARNSSRETSSIWRREYRFFTYRVFFVVQKYETDRTKKVTYGGEFFHRDRFVIEDTFVHSAEASLPESAAAVGHVAVVEVPRYLDQLAVGETGKI